MYWQEKIDIIKRKYPTPVFKDPFYSGPSIIEKIRNKFFNTSWKASSDAAPVHIIDAILVKQISAAHLYDELELLPEGVNYWLMLNDTPMGLSNQVYDCQKEPLSVLVSWAYAVRNGFYVADKKYKWIIYFILNAQTNMIEMYKGGILSPFG